MRAYLISDNLDTLVGMRLAGINGVVVHGRDEVTSKVKEVSKDKEIGVILITEKAADEAKELVGKLKSNMGLPLIVEIPDRHGTLQEKDRITRYIKEAIGLKI